MDAKLYYSVFLTDWGWCGYVIGAGKDGGAGSKREKGRDSGDNIEDYSIVRVVLPQGSEKEVEKYLPVGINRVVKRVYVGGSGRAKELAEQLDSDIKAYFTGVYIDFSRYTVGWELIGEIWGLSGFARRVLEACREVKYGQTVSYGELAKRAGGGKGSARAAGRVLSQNRVPIVVPCHRVIRADGSIGGFMGCDDGDCPQVRLKIRMLEMEKIEKNDITHKNF